MPERAAVGRGGVIRLRTDLGDRAGQRVGQAAGAAAGGRRRVGAGPVGGSTTAGKNDSNDALWTAIAGLRQGWLRTVRVEDHHAVIRVLIDRYDGLVSWHCCTSEAELDVAPDASSTLGLRAPQRGAGATNVCRAAPGGSHLYA